MKNTQVAASSFLYTLLMASLCFTMQVFAADPAGDGVAIGSAGFNEMLAKQIQPGVLTTEQNKDGSFQINNPVQTIQALVTPKGTTFTSTSKEKNKGGQFSLSLAQWGREGSLQEAASSTIYRDGDNVFHTHIDGIAEKFSNSGNGIQQDFIIAVKPEGAGPLHVQLHIDGATVKTKSDGLVLSLNNSQREFTYDRLKVMDANNKTIPAQINIAGNGLVDIQVDDAAAQYPLTIDPTVGDANWVSMGSIPGADGTIYAIVHYGSDIYVGGNFTVIGNLAANNIAKWNGTAWSGLGLGTTENYTVYALAVDSSGNLYAGGTFLAAGGVANTANIAKWNGSSWSALGTGVNNTVLALAIDSNDNLYAGGSFSGVLGNYIAQWNGSVWSSVGGGLAGSGAVGVLACDSSGNVYAGGSGYIAKWNGSAWATLGSGVSGNVNALVVDVGGNVYAGGNINISGQGYGVAKWDGNIWTIVGGGMGGPLPYVNSLLIDGSGTLYAGGSFTSTYGGYPNAYIAKWDGNTWSSLNTNVNNNVYALTFDGNNNLYAGGTFMAAGSAVAARIAKWDGASWSALASGTIGIMGTTAGVSINVHAIAFDSTGNLYVGGNFTSAGNVVNTTNIAKWNGTVWSALGSSALSGSTPNIYAIVFDVNDNLYMGGKFASVGGVANTANIAKWNGTVWSAVGTGMNGDVATLVFDNSGNLYAGGSFTTAGGVSANRIARWNGSVWAALGTGLNNKVNAAVFDSSGNLFVGGQFTLAGGASANRIAKWDGSAWSTLGTGVNNFIYALVMNSSGNLYAGGGFTTAGGVSALGVAEWNGSTWSALGSGMNAGGGTFALVMDSFGNLYAGGYFTTAGGIANTRYIAKWDGSTWSALGSGVNNNVYALACNGNSDIFSGGYFTVAGNRASTYLARWVAPSHYTSNFDGLNNTDDLVLTGPDVQVWTTANNVISSFNYIDAMPDGGATSLVATPDVNGDGVNDMVFQPASGGNIYTWVMGNAGSTKTAYWLTSTSSIIKGGGDFDNDGDGDLVLQDEGSGAVSVILLQDGQIVAFNWLGDFPLFRVKAVGDINGDATDDIIMQDPSTFDIASITMLNGQKLAAAWQERWPGRVVIGTGDANGDGTDDIYTSYNGDLAIVPMLNGSYTGGYWVGAFTNYTPYAVADVDGDGNADYVLQDTSGNVATVTIDSNYTVKAATWLGNWDYSVKGAIDTDGDLDADVVIQRISTGAVAIIEMQNGGNLATRWIANTPNTVQVLP